MKNRNLYIAWGIFAVFCGVLGFVPSRDGLFFALRMGLGLGFFAPPAMLLYRSYRRREWNTVKLLRGLSACSLSLTVLLMVLNILTVGAAEAVGLFMYVLLALVSIPFCCIEVGYLSLFLWACLLMTSLFLLRKKK